MYGGIKIHKSCKSVIQIEKKNKIKMLIHYSILHGIVIASSLAKVSSYLPFDKPFASRPSKFIISAD